MAVQIACCGFGWLVAFGFGICLWWFWFRTNVLWVCGMVALGLLAECLCLVRVGVGCCVGLGFLSVKFGFVGFGGAYLLLVSTTFYGCIALWCLFG